MTRPLQVYNFPVTPYKAALRWQHETADAVRNGAGDALALLQHPPVYTRGRLSRPEHLLVDADNLRARGAEVLDTDRGGGITFHGPGQLVAYPVIDLRRRRLGAIDYVRLLEEVVMRALQHFGIEAERSPGRPGVWLRDAKIAAIGVRIRGGVTSHGFALNVDNRLSWFDAIVPCGIEGAGVTSIGREQGHSPGIDVVARQITREFAAVFDYDLQPRMPGERVAGHAPA